MHIFVHVQIMHAVLAVREKWLTIVNYLVLSGY